MIRYDTDQTDQTTADDRAASSLDAAATRTVETYTNRFLHGDALSVLRQLPAALFQTCCTSPPYFQQRDYSTAPVDWPDGWRGELGREPSISGYIAHLVEIFREVRRVLRPDGTLWVVIGDKYANDQKWGGVTGGKHHTGMHGVKNGAGMRGRLSTGLPPKSLMLIPHRLAIALQDDGWIVRQDIIWQKEAILTESVSDRPTTCHEHVLLCSVAPRYYYDQEAIREPARDWGTRDRSRGKMTSGTPPNLSGPHHGMTDINFAARGRNARSVWTINPTHFDPGDYGITDIDHYAVFPEELPRRCIRAGSRPGDLVLDIFSGAGTTALVALQEGRGFTGIELNPDFIRLAQARIAPVATVAAFAGGTATSLDATPAVRQPNLFAGTEEGGRDAE